MNHKPKLAIRLYMEMQNLRFKDFEGIMSKPTISSILNGRAVSVGKLRDFDKILNSGGLIHLLYIIDRLYTVSNDLNIKVNPDLNIFPDSVPDKLQNLMLKIHPLYQNN